jgi:hypothetical protein
MGTELDTLKPETPLNAKLLANARRPLSETAKLLGMSVQQVSEKYSTFFDDPNWRTTLQNEQLIMMEAADVLDDARKVMAEADIRDYASIANVVLKSIKLIADRLDARKKLVEADIQQITRGQAHVFGEAFDLTLKHVVDGLAVLYPEIDKNDVDDLVDEGILIAKRKLEEHINA